MVVISKVRGFVSSACVRRGSPLAFVRRARRAGGGPRSIRFDRRYCGCGARSRPPLCRVPRAPTFVIMERAPKRASNVAVKEENALTIL